MGLDLQDGMDLIRKAMERTRQEMLFQQWVVQLPLMAMAGGKEAYISFEDYCKQMAGAGIDNRPTEELLAEIEALEREFTKGDS